MAITAPEQNQSSSGSGSSTVMALALFLLLLAFFILLVAISKFETEKIDQVLFSLEEAFEIPPEILLSDQNVTSRDGNLNEQQTFFEVVDKLFRDELQFAKVRVVTEGDQMIVAVPIDAVFEASSIELRVETAGLIGRLSETLKKPVEDGQYHLDMVIPIGRTEADRDLSVRRAGRFARALTAYGAPPRAISIGVRQRLRNEVHFYFEAREIGSDVLVTGLQTADNASEASTGANNAQR